MSLLDLDSDSDLENAMFEYEFNQKSRAPREFRVREFTEDVSDVVYRQRYRFNFANNLQKNEFVFRYDIIVQLTLIIFYYPN